MDTDPPRPGGSASEGQDAIPSYESQLESATISDDIIVVSETTAAQQPSDSVPVTRGATDQPKAAIKLTTLSFEDVHRIKSSPLDQVFVQRLSRARSDQQETPQPMRQALEKLRSRVFTHILSQLNIRDIATSGLEQRYLNWCLPRLLDHELWDRILDDCLFVTPAELEQVLDLHDVAPVYSGEPSGATRFYVRTLAFEVQELLRILSELSKERYDYNRKIFNWTERLKNVDPRVIVYIRYGGMSEYEPWKRHLDDLTKDIGSFSLAFIQKTLLTYPNVIKNAVVQEVRDARVDFPVDQSILNLREQALISLIDSGALNTEAGGAFQHDPTTEEERVFATLNTRVSTQLATSTKPCGPEKLRQIQDLATSIMRYANDNPVLTGTNHFTFVQAHCDAIIRGMIPSLLHNNMTPFVTMSSDIPLSAFKNPNTFFLDAGCSAHLSATVFNFFGAWEQGLGRFDVSYVSQMVKDHQLTFIDLFPWPKKDQATIEHAMGFVRQYFAIVSPLVVLTHGEDVSSIVLGNLQHSHGLRDGCLLDAVGQLHLRRIHTPMALGNLDSGYCVVIPSFHPGAVAYRGTAIGITKSIFYMTAMIGWLAYHEGLARSNSADSKREICKQIIAAVNAKVGPDTPFGKRLEALKAELSREMAQKRSDLLTSAEKAARKTATRAAAKQLTKERWTESETARPSGQDLYSALKLKYVVYSGSRGIIMATPSSIWAQARTELDVVLQSGFAFTLPESPQRLLEVDTIYEKHIASLQNSTESRGDKAKFVGFAKSSKVPKGSSYYLSAANVDDAVKDLPNLVRCFLPDSVADPYHGKWARVFNNTMQSIAVNNLRAWLKEGMSNATNNDEAANLVAARWSDHMQKDPAVFSLLGKQTSTSKTRSNIFSTDEDLNGTEITIKAHNANFDATVVKHSFSWMTLDGKMANDKRFIFFVPEGIDIKDQHGNSIDAYELKGAKQAGKQAGKLKMSVYPTLSIATLVATLANHPHGKHFLDLWEKQTGCKVDDSIESSQVQRASSSSDDAVIPAEYFTGRTPRPLPVSLNYNANAKKTVRGLLPVYPGDGLWLFNEFWTDTYPQGGEVRITNPSEDTSGESVFSKLAIFLQKPLYRHHPFVTDLRALAELSRQGGDDKKKATSTLKSSADVLRGLSKAATTGTMRVKATFGAKSMVIGITRFSINANAPNGVIANVPPPVLTSVAAPPTELEVTDEVPDDDDYDEHEEDDLKRKKELEEFLEQANAEPIRTGTPKRPRDPDDDEDEDERAARNRDFGRIWGGRLL
ncbi:hypothetical protein KCU92_g5931, partial [Aureobasidium melanogenum]